MKKLLQLMENLPENLDAALITADVNRYYYTEFPSSAGTLVVTRDESYLIIDSRYFEVASQNAVNCTVLLQEGLFAQISDLLKKHNVEHIGLESDTLTLTECNRYIDALYDFDVIIDRTLSACIEKQRSVKCPTEKKYLQLSQNITDKTFDYACSIIKEGMTEIEIALAMEMWSREHGSEGAAFSFIVAAGSNTSRPHAVPSTNKVKKGDFVLMDFGSTYKGYLSDMTRTVAVGEPSEKQKEVYYTVLEAQKRAIAVVKEGVALRSVHELAADYINSTPYKGLFSHGLGHSVGLEIHENPNFNGSATENAVAGNVITVEPGIYIPGEFGVRIEDYGYITEDGYENFTHSPKEELIIL